MKWVKSLSRVQLCDAMDCSLPGSSVHGIFQAVVLEWIAISFSSRSSRPRYRAQVSCIVDRRFTVWTKAALDYAKAPSGGWWILIDSSVCSFFSLSIFFHWGWKFPGDLHYHFAGSTISSDLPDFLLCQHRCTLETLRFIYNLHNLFSDFRYLGRIGKIKRNDDSWHLI